MTPSPPGSLVAALDGASSATRHETRLMAKALAFLFGSGATLALLTVLLPHSAETNELGLLLVVAQAYVVAGVLFVGAERMPRWALPAALAAGSLDITAVAFFSAESPSPLVFFYLWVFLFSSYFFSKREAIAQILLVAIAYAGLLLALPPPTAAVAWWIVGIGTLVVAALLIAKMRERADLLIAGLYEAARTDPLTGLVNRRGFRELLDLELERSHRSSHSVTVVLGDVDHFKEVNDRLGHHVGDSVLRRVAQVLESGKRQVDVVARVGGEEFALILPETDAGGALTLAERLRCSFADEFAGDSVPVTISFGIATFPAQGETAGAILQASDDAVYAAKAHGRNRTVLFNPELAESERRSARDIEGERYLAVVLELAEAVDLRFSGSARHAETVGRYAEMMARELRLPEARIARVRLAGILHDVGKVGVPDAILRKPGKLDAAEWETMRKHPELGAQILEHPCLSDVREWVGAHHERPDGRGYPRGLSGPSLPVETRVLAIADAYEAMTSHRSYRTAMAPEDARAELRHCAGTQFDPRVVEAFISILEREADRAEEVPVPA